MKRGVAVAVWTSALLVLQGCSAAPPPSAAAPPPSIAVSYEDGAPPIIEVTAVSTLMLTAAELVARDGRVLRTVRIERVPPPESGFFTFPPSVGVGLFGGSGGVGTGIGLGFPLGGYSPPPPMPMRVKATLPIEDVEAYRRDWYDLLVRLRFGSQPGDTTVADLPAPAPRP